MRRVSNSLRFCSAALSAFCRPEAAPLRSKVGKKARVREKRYTGRISDRTQQATEVATPIEADEPVSAEAAELPGEAETRAPEALAGDAEPQATETGQPSGDAETPADEAVPAEQRS